MANKQKIKEIKEFLNKCGVSNTRHVAISDNYVISLNANIHFTTPELPFKFDKIVGNITTSSNLISFKNFPETVRYSVNVSGTQISSLDQSPRNILGVFSITDCQNITSLKYLPDKIRELRAIRTGIIDPYEFRYILYSDISHSIELGYKNAKTQDILDKYKNQPSMYHIAIEELMDLGESLGFI